MIHPRRFVPNTDPENAGYVYNDDVIRAIKVALATERPLLLRGKPGTGKTTLAKDLARILQSGPPGTPPGADYYQEVVTSRTEARDLEWRFDAIHRLSETQLEQTRPRVANAANYVEPRALWWAFDPNDAVTRGGGDLPARDPLFPGSSNPHRPAVVLVDEIDKAEPEVANDLLEPFDVKEFQVAETGHKISAKRDVFLVVTTNDERDLPAAFLRRCVVHELKRPADDVLKKIARSHLKTSFDDAGVARMIERLKTLAKEAVAQRLREPGIAEFLDALRAVRVLEPGANNTEWDAITRLAMWKHPEKETTAT